MLRRRPAPVKVWRPDLHQVGDSYEGRWMIPAAISREIGYKRNEETVTMPELPEDLQRAIEAGTLTNEQIRQLIELEARVIGLSFDEALAKAQDRSLPSNPVGSDLQMLFGLLKAA
jgi:hypothetical protein